MPRVSRTTSDDVVDKAARSHHPVMRRRASRGGRVAEESSGRVRASWGPSRGGAAGSRGRPKPEPLSSSARGREGERRWRKTMA
jgi:hypothetical protein